MYGILGWITRHRRFHIPQYCKAKVDTFQAYISGNTVIILKGPQEILQTIYVDDVDELEAVNIEESSGTIAVCSQEQVYIYGPIGRDEGVLKVYTCRSSGYGH